MATGSKRRGRTVGADASVPQVTGLVVLSEFSTIRIGMYAAAPCTMKPMNCATTYTPAPSTPPRSRCAG